MVPCYTINKLRDKRLTYYHINKSIKRKEVIIMSKTTNTTTNIKDVIREIKEYQVMQDELKKANQ